MNVYTTPWYLNAIAPQHKRWQGFVYVVNDRGEAASPYGYPGITGDVAQIRKDIGMPLFIRHAVDATPVGTGHPTRIMPTYDPWTTEAAAEVKRAEKAGVNCWQSGRTLEAFDRFTRNYRLSMEHKNAGQKYLTLADRIALWIDNPAVIILETRGAGAMFLVDGMWGHYHLSWKHKEAHNLAMAAIFSTAVDMLKERGVEKVHLGGGMTGAPDDPLYRFKSRWGRTPHHVYFQEVP